LTHGRNALLVDPFSPRQIAEAVEELARNDHLWESLHREGRRFVEETIRWDRYAESVMEIFLQAAGRGG
jgi:glycosyltransferase involved in cell wall biosynthesis